MLDQQLYVEKLLKESGMYGCSSMKTPALTRKAEQYEECEKNTPESISESQNDSRGGTTVQQDTPKVMNYRAAVGSLLYAALSTRPDITYAVAELSKHVSAPTEEHWQQCRRVLRYLQGTTSVGLMYGQQGDASLITYSDADWAGDRTSDAKSTSGAVHLIGGAPVSWSSKKQSTVALSSTEAEYIAASTAVQETLWLRQLLHDITGRAPAATPLYCDNQSSMVLMADNRQHQRTKHINVKYHFIREHVRDGAVEVRWVKSEEQLADVLTKPLGNVAFTRLRDRLVQPVSASHGD
jgi:hypothetical protein